MWTLLRAALCLAALPLLTPLLAAGESPPPGPGVPLVFELVSIDGVEVPYLLTSPNDGDILDRGLRSRTLTMVFAADRGEWVHCYDRANVRLAQAPRQGLVEREGEEPLGLFQIQIDTRTLPNGPNRLFFRLYDSERPLGPVTELLAELRVIVHVLNTRLEIERNGVDSLGFAIEAGVIDPATIRNYRFAVFAGASRTPRRILDDFRNPPEMTTRPIPIGGPATVGEDPLKLFPLADGGAPYALWPEGTLTLHFQVSWAELARVFPQEEGSEVVFLVAAVFDGTSWDWSSILQAAPPAPGEGLLPAE